MRKWRTALAAISFALALAGSFAAYRLTGSAQGNAGDIWVDNVGQPSGPGHEQDPHLMCADINLWGHGLADASGIFIIDSWATTGSGATACGPAPWTCNQTTGGNHVLAVIPISSLLAGSAANGDIPRAQPGLHFKLQFVEDRQKHKTASPTLTPTQTGSPSPTSTDSVAPTATPTGSPSPVPSTTVPPATLAGTGGGSGSVAGRGGTTVPLAMILILVGGLLLARDAFRR